jgi:hypothetical protein
MVEAIFLAPDPTSIRTLKGKINAVETMIAARPLEEAHVFTADGRRIIAKVGERDARGQVIRFEDSELARMRGCTMTHNHPVLPEGTSFTPEDIAMMLMHGLHEIRAVGQKYRYSMTVEPGRGELHWPDVEGPYTVESASLMAECVTQIRAGTMTVAFAELNHRHIVWTLIAPKVGLVYSRKEW